MPEQLSEARPLGGVTRIEPITAAERSSADTNDTLRIVICSLRVSGASAPIGPDSAKSGRGRTHAHNEPTPRLDERGESRRLRLRTPCKILNETFRSPVVTR